MIPLDPAMGPVWKPQWKYDREDTKSGHKIPSAMVLEDQALYECPVSLITAQSAELTRLYNQARRQKKTLSRLLNDSSAHMEDVEEAFEDGRMLIKLGWEKERDRHHG